MPVVKMALYIWLVVRAMLRELWRSVWAESGALFVMTAGMGMMQQLSANSWGSKEQVRCFILASFPGPTQLFIACSMENGAGLGTRLVLPSWQLYIFMCVTFNIKTMEFAFTNKNSQAVANYASQLKLICGLKSVLPNLLNKLSNVCSLVIYCLTGTQEYNYRPESCCHPSISFIIFEIALSKGSVHCYSVKLLIMAICLL